MERGYRQIEHTADIAFELWAPTEADLLRVAAEAVVAHMTEDDPPPRANERRSLELAARDAGDRLVQWMNEVIYWAVVDALVYVDAEITVEEVLIAHAQCAKGHPVRQELKAATYHDLKVEQTEKGWRAQVVLDV